MTIIEELIGKKEKLAVIGLGYVGLPIAVSFAKTVDVIGFDINEKKVNEYKMGKDGTNEVGNDEISKTTIEFTSDEEKLLAAKFNIIAVPTPLNSDNTPDLTPLEKASEIMGRNLKKGDYVVFESTVYPGVTEEVCLPILEKNSNLKGGVDFKIGYSPERINPGDKQHRLENIVKVVSGCDDESLEEIAGVYEHIVKAGTYKVKNIKTAEAAKIIENSQRDINIAFMNELSIIFNKMNINTGEVLKAASTKWNFLNFMPGLVGGHCIGVDPYYLTYKAQQLGYNPDVILAGRKINDQMGEYIIHSAIKLMIKNQMSLKSPKVAIMGLTFKENTPDIRNTRVIDMYHELQEYGITPKVCDPVVQKDEVRREYGFDIVDFEDIKDMDVVIFAVAHKEFENLTEEELSKMFGRDKKIVIDVKGIVDCPDSYIYWSL